MRRQWSTLVVLVGSLVFLSSLYLPWRQATCGNTQSGSFKGPGDVAGLPNLFLSSCRSIDGLSSNVGRAAAVIALVLLTVALTALVRPDLEARLPLGTCALATTYFAAAVARQTVSLARRQPAESLPLHARLGTYLGLAAAVLVLFAAATPQARDLMRDRSVLSLTRFTFAAGLLATFLLPWQSYPYKGEPTITFLGIERPATIIAAGCGLLLPLVLWRADPHTPLDTLLLAATAALLTGAAISRATTGLGLQSFKALDG